MIVTLHRTCFALASTSILLLGACSGGNAPVPTLDSSVGVIPPPAPPAPPPPPAPPVAPPPPTTSASATSSVIDWQTSYAAPETDFVGNRLTGTEITEIVAHQQKLFAGTSYWNETTEPRQGQILRLDDASDDWALEFEMPRRYSRVASLASVTLQRDADGQDISEQSYLLAGATFDYGQSDGPVGIFVDGENEDWSLTTLGTTDHPIGFSEIRSIGMWRDTETGADLVFLGASPEPHGIYVGQVDPASGLLTWDSEPELAAVGVDRFLYFTPCDGHLYAGAKRRIYRRTDGALTDGEARWTLFADLTDPNIQAEFGGILTDPNWISEDDIRGLVCFIDQEAGDPFLMFGGLNQLFRLDLDAKLSQELNLDAFVEEELGRPIRYIQTAEHTRYQSEDNQDSEQVSLIGLELQYEPDFIAENPGVPHFPTSYFSTEGFYIERRTATDGTHYTLRTVDREPDEDLARVRTFEESPFPDDPEGTLFVGGYAAWFTPSTNTAWIKKGSPLDISSLSPDAVIERTNDWRGTGVEVLSLTPNDWTPESATLIFSHGAGSSPETYICWGDVPARNGIRVLMPYLDTGITTRTRTSRYSDIAALHGEVSQEQSTDEIVFGGHSFGAYVTLLAASANGRLGNANPQNCSDTDCPTLSAAGYIMLSGQPAQSAQADPPFWFEEDAFENLAPGLTVVYGTEDYSQVDPCMAPFSGTPTCRGDAFTASVDSPEARANQEIVVPGFQHGNFSCGINWRDRPTAATLSDLLDDIIVRVQTQTGGE